MGGRGGGWRGKKYDGITERKEDEEWEERDREGGEGGMGKRKVKGTSRLGCS